jgi:hypothetical protein
MLPGHRSAPVEIGAQSRIGSLLRAMYDSALKEPVPQRLLDVLKQTDASAETALRSVAEDEFKQPDGR